MNHFQKLVVLCSFVGLIQVELCAQICEEFVSYDNICSKADLVVVARVLQEEKDHDSEVGGWRLGRYGTYTLRVEYVLKGSASKTTIVARLADMRPTRTGEKEIGGAISTLYIAGDMTIGGRYLLFLMDTSDGWDVVPQEGSTLPVSRRLEVTLLKDKPLKDVICIVLNDYMDYTEKSCVYTRKYTRLLLHSLAGNRLGGIPRYVVPVVLLCVIATVFWIIKRHRMSPASTQ